MAPEQSTLSAKIVRLENVISDPSSNSGRKLFAFQFTLTSQDSKIQLRTNYRADYVFYSRYSSQSRQGNSLNSIQPYFAYKLILCPTCGEGVQ